MRKLILGLAALVVVLSGPVARAEFGTSDVVPAATLLVPYFEVDLNSANGVTTLFSINNASASAAVAHVTLWTNLAIPTLNFDVYLTGYDVQTINLRDIFNGVLPVTADAGADPTNTVSRKGPLSQDINFPGSTGPCGFSGTLYSVPDPTLPIKVAHVRAAHTGGPSTVFGGRCSGVSSGDNVARGYVTIDSVTQCNLLFPSDPGYFSGGVADTRNILWGDFFYVDSINNFAQGDSLVHVEACQGANYSRYDGSAGAACPAAGAYTFYGRYVAAAATDRREALPTTFASRYVNGGTFTGGTDLITWRDSKVAPTGPTGPFVCGPNPPAQFILEETDVVSFDEQENATDACAATACFPYSAQRASTSFVSSTFGWVYANLNHTVAGDPFPAVGQAWVMPVMDANGRFSVGYRATALDNASATSGSGTVLIP